MLRRISTQIAARFEGRYISSSLGHSGRTFVFPFKFSGKFTRVQRYTGTGMQIRTEIVQKHNLSGITYLNHVLPLVVDRGLYSVHSYFTPYTQENGTLNFCWRSLNGDVNLDRFCHVFRAHIPGLYKQAEVKNTTVSFESVCLPGYFVRQKNYHFILQKRDGSELFGKKFCNVGTNFIYFK